MIDIDIRAWWFGYGRTFLGHCINREDAELEKVDRCQDGALQPLWLLNLGCGVMQKPCGVLLIWSQMPQVAARPCHAGVSFHATR
jgi:hypothetical protein